MAKRPKALSSIPANSGMQKPHLPKFAFFMAAALVFYEREGGQKQRHINVLVQLPDSAQINKASLESINRAAVTRICTENNVEPHDIRDVVILSLNLLSVCTEREFQGEPASLIDQNQKAPA